MQPTRRHFLAAGLATTVAVAAPALPAADGSFDLAELGFDELRRRSARSLAQKYLARIEAIDRRGPTLNSVIELNPDALEIADKLDHNPGGQSGPLRGMPTGMPV